jgi:hypothetical protein
MKSNYKKSAATAGAVLCCCIAVFAYVAKYFLQHRDELREPPQWLGYVCGITAIVGMISIAVLITSLIFGLFRREDKKVGDQVLGNPP